MPDISTRINALIAYLFLGPIMLFARPWTPLAHPYVRWHAKKASLLILGGVIGYLFYRSIHSLLIGSIFGITIDTIVLMLLVSAILLILIVWAYRAYSGINADVLSWRSLSIPENSIQIWDYSEESKIRIVASFIPFIGIIIANKYPTLETFIGRKVGSVFMFILLTSILFFQGSTTTLTLIITITYIGLIVTTLVYLFGFSQFLNFKFYKNIPTYLEFDAHIKASIVTIFDFFRIAFGGMRQSDYHTQYEKFLKENQRIEVATQAYFAPTWIIAIPGINLITLPSLRQSQYREYIPMILQGFLITLATGIIFTLYGIWSQMELYLLFPIITLIVEGQRNILVRAPLCSIMVDLYSIFKYTQSKLETIKQEGEEKVSHTYEVKEEPKNTEEK